ncbi:MAG: UvrD-helicase domain-containing protein, partial [Planctomycetota bacterium]
MLRRSDALDFDGLLIEARALFETSETARERWRSRVRELLVDEAQDVAAIEWDVLGALVDKDGGARLFAVGDP